MEWTHSHFPKKQKFKTTLPARNIMCSVFWERQCILLVEFLSTGETINAERYCETFRKLRGKLSRGIVLLHDNAHSHSAAITLNHIEQFGWEQFDHLLHSHDLAPLFTLTTTYS